MEPRGRAYFHEVVRTEDEVGEAGLPRDFSHAEEVRGLSPAGARLRRERGVLPEDDGEFRGERVEERSQERAGNEVNLREDENDPGGGELVGDGLLYGEAAGVLRWRGRRGGTMASRASTTSRITSLLLIYCMEIGERSYVRQRRAVVVDVQTNGVRGVGGGVLGFHRLHVGNFFSAGDRFFSRLRIDWVDDAYSLFTTLGTRFRSFFGCEFLHILNLWRERKTQIRTS